MTKTVRTKIGPDFIAHALKPSEVRIEPTGILLDAFGKAELEVMGGLVVRWHQLNSPDEWKPLSREDIVALIATDELAFKWAGNPFLRPDPAGFQRAGLIDGWYYEDRPTPADKQGTLTDLFHRLVEYRGTHYRLELR